MVIKSFKHCLLKEFVLKLKTSSVFLTSFKCITLKVFSIFYFIKSLLKANSSPKLVAALFSFLVLTPSLKGEIQEITFNWNAFKCQGSCISQIEFNFRGIAGVEELNLNPQAGSAVIKWKPSTPLSYEPFRYASAAVGITIRSIRVRIKGRISRIGSDFFLISDGDGTRLHLVGPIETQPGRYTPSYNLATHPLSSASEEALTQAELNDSIVVISGPLLLPSYYPLTLIAEQIQLSKQKKVKKDKFHVKSTYINHVFLI